MFQHHSKISAICLAAREVERKGRKIWGRDGCTQQQTDMSQLRQGNGAAVRGVEALQVWSELEERHGLFHPHPRYGVRTRAAYGRQKDKAGAFHQIPTR